MIGGWCLRGTATRYFGVLWLPLSQGDRRAPETGSAYVFDDCMRPLCNITCTYNRSFTQQIGLTHATRTHSWVCSNRTALPQRSWRS